MERKLLEKYCNNSCTEEELNVVLNWFEESAGTPEGKRHLFEIWEELVDKEENIKVNFDLLLDKIHHEVNLSQSKKLLQQANRDTSKFIRRREFFIRILTKVAAIFLLPVIGFALYMFLKCHLISNNQASVNQAYNEVFSSVDAITKVTLPDGSNVWLNHNSSLRYPAMFRGKYRTVELKGEGYFEIAHNSKIAFVVNAGEIKVIAHGTTFNLLAYPEEDRIETSLIEGSVELQKSGSEGKIVTLLKMKPTDLAVFHKTINEISTRTVPDDRYFSWKDGKLIFNKEPMDEVAKRLSRWFNVDIQIKDSELYDLTYTATFVNETLPQVMELIALVTPVKYSISKREKTSQGVFSKRTVILRSMKE